MTNHEKSIQLAKLTIALEEIKQRIYGEILPLCAHLALQETIEMAQTLELAAETIASHQKKWQMIMERVKGGER